MLMTLLCGIAMLKSQLCGCTHCSAFCVCPQLIFDFETAVKHVCECTLLVAPSITTHKHYHGKHTVDMMHVTTGRVGLEPQQLQNHGSTYMLSLPPTKQSAHMHCIVAQLACSVPAEER